MEDHQMIELLWKRSEPVLEEIQRKYSGTCMEISRNITGSWLDAEECVNDLLLSVWNAIPPERPQSLPAYLYRVIRNLSLRRFRYNTAEKRKQSNTVPIDELYQTLADPATDRTPESNLFPDAINAFLGTLNAENRILFVRRYFFEDSVSSISALTGLSENSIHQRLHKIRLKLRKYLQKEGLLYE